MESSPIDSKRRKISSEDKQMFRKSFNSPRSWKNFDRPSSTVSIAVKKLFNKHFEIQNNEEFQLPNPENMFSESAWQIEDLQKLKEELNEMKSRLNDYNLMEWQYHTRKRNQAGDIQWRVRRDINPEFLTQAWCKFYENVASFPLVPDESLKSEKLKSVHLCEAPGAFVASLNHWLRINSHKMEWNWIGTTLNPHYEGNSLSMMIKDDRFILQTIDNWFFGADNTGNLMKLNNLDELLIRAGDNVMLTTADGSINCMNSPDEQELLVSHLHYCEAIAALHLLQFGGSFLIKLFTIFEHQTVCLTYLLTCCFDRVIFNKPATSKEGNSEVYLVCLGFKGPAYISPYLKKLRDNYEKESDLAIFRKEDIPMAFVDQIVRNAEFFKAHQCEVISSNIRTFQTVEEDWEIKKIRRAAADNFIRIYKLKKLSEELEIVGNRTGQSHCETLESKFSHDSYNNRRKKEHLGPLDRLSIIFEELHGISTENLIFSFQLSGKPEDLKISLGIPYERIESSRFCVTNLLKTFNSTFQIQKELNLSWIYPDTDATEKFIHDSKKEEMKILCFQYTTKMTSVKTIQEIYEALISLQTNQTLVLLGYSVIGQLNVGILYLLAHSFEKLEMRTTVDLGCIIKLKNFTNDTNVVEAIRKIFETSEKANQECEAVLSVIPIAKLCDLDMYHKIMQINHWIIKNFVSHILKYANES